MKKSVEEKAALEFLKSFQKEKAVQEQTNPPSKRPEEGPSAGDDGLFTEEESRMDEGESVTSRSPQEPPSADYEDTFGLFTEEDSRMDEDESVTSRSPQEPPSADYEDTFGLFS